MRTNGNDVVDTIAFAGSSGFQDFSAAGRFAVPDVRGFDSTWRSVGVDGVQVAEWFTSPISGIEYLPRDADRVMLIAILEGSVRYWTAGRGVDARSGSMHLLSSDEDVRFAVLEPCRLFRVSIPGAFLPPDLRSVIARSVGAVPVTRVTAGLTFLVEQVLDPVVGGAECPAARALRALTLAVLEDSVPERAEHDLRERILDHIERHLGDPGLGPHAIAAEFGISLRWVHQVFNVHGDSVARHIRDRRLDVVAARLRADHRFPRVSALAERAGFATRDQLARSFRARYGVTIAEYAALAAEGRAPQPVQRDDPGASDA